MGSSNDAMRHSGAGMTICMTGGCPPLTRDSLRAASEDAGFTVKTHVSTLVDVLVAADPTSQSCAARKARQLGIPIAPYEWLMRRLGDGESTIPRQGVLFIQ